MEVELKTCTLCRENKDETEFPRHKGGKNGLHPRCRACKRIDSAESRKKLGPEYQRAYLARTRYGLTLEEYYSLKSRGCDICGKEEDIHIDHDHSCCGPAKACSKCIRGVLCGSHNRALGLVKDDIDQLQKLIEYLKFWKGK